MAQHLAIIRQRVPGIQLPTGATLPVFPTGCTVDSAHNDTLASCCAAVGSAPVQVNGISGCAYSDAFPPSANQTFCVCALEQGASSSCAPATDARVSHASALRWSDTAVGLVLLGQVIAALVS